MSSMKVGVFVWVSERTALDTTVNGIMTNMEADFLVQGFGFRRIYCTFYRPICHLLRALSSSAQSSRISFYKTVINFYKMYDLLPKYVSTSVIVCQNCCH